MEKLIYAILIVLAIIGATSIFIKVGDFLFNSKMEAEKNNKKIEYGMFIVSVFALTISIVGVIYTIYYTDKLADRVDKLEMIK